MSIDGVDVVLFFNEIIIVRVILYFLKMFEVFGKYFKK